MQILDKLKLKLVYNNNIKKYNENVTKQFKHYKLKKLIIRRK